jgi:hypothetical protein
VQRPSIPLFRVLEHPRILHPSGGPWIDRLRSGKLQGAKAGTIDFASRRSSFVATRRDSALSHVHG